MQSLSNQSIQITQRDDRTLHFVWFEQKKRFSVEEEPWHNYQFKTLDLKKIAIRDGFSYLLLSELLINVPKSYETYLVEPYSTGTHYMPMMRTCAIRLNKLGFIRVTLIY